MSKSTGFRAMTPGINNALLLSEQWGAQTAVAKDRAVLAFNKVSSLLPLNAQAREIMNRLLSFTRECDWEPDTRPLAWPDNQRLIDQTGLSLAALKRNFRALAEAGLIAFKDSPSGRRIGRRNAHTGKIDLERSYGIDLSPLGIMTPELEAIAAEEERRANHMRNLAHQFTRDRKMLTSILEAASDNDLPGPWPACAGELATLAYARRGRCDTARLTSLCERIAAVLERARTAYAAAVDKFDKASKDHPAPAEAPAGAEGNGFDKKMSPMGLAGEPPIQNTTEIKSNDLYKDERRSAHADQFNSFGAGTAGEEGLRIKLGAAELSEQAQKIEAKPIDPPTLLVLCPKLREWVFPKSRPTWADIIMAAETIARPTLQIPDSTWKAACLKLGRETAAAAVALIFEKHAEGLIENPGAYLNGMLTKADGGKLHLPASLFHWRKPRKKRDQTKTMN